MSQDPELPRASGAEPETTRLQRRVDQLTVLIEIARRLRRPFDPVELLDEIVATARDSFEVEACSLLLADPESRSLTFHTASGGKAEEVKEIGPIPYGQGIAGWVAEERAPALVNDVDHDSRFIRTVDQAVDFRTTSILAVPLVDDDRDELLGVIEILNKTNGRPFDDYDQRLLQMMAQQASEAIQFVRREVARQRDVRLATIGEMASSIIHDIKNPMASIKGFAQLIANRSPENRRYAEIIVREIDRLVGMTQELLDYSKGVQLVRVDEIAADDLIAEVVGFLERDLESAGIEVVTDLAYDGPLAIDRLKVVRAILNIASNARDAMADGGRLILATRKTERGIELSITDSGQGMPAHIAERIFEPFFTTKEGRGTGLGMAIVAAVIEAHAGRIEVDSTPGQGTTFTLVFPSRSPDAADR